jgi:hypothetical protein
MTKSKPKSQIEKFRAAARTHEADKDEGKFNDALRRVAKASPPKSEKKSGKSER